MRFRAALFDLDGTLLDTLADLGESMNEALGEIGAPGHPLDAYKGFVGDGVTNLVRRALPVDFRDDATVERCVAAMRRIYGGRWDRKTEPYPGIESLLSALEARGLALAVLSNKPHDLTQTIVRTLLPTASFVEVAGARPGVPHKPDPAAALTFAARLSLSPAEVVYVGDTDTDMQTATRAEMFAVGALWGFRTADELLANGARELIRAPDDLLDILE